MDAVFSSVDPQLVLLIAAIAVVVLAAQLFFKILSAGLVPIIGLVAIVVALQYMFGISPQQLWLEVNQLPQMALDFFNSLA